MILEVDLEYLKELIELHNEYALAPEKIQVKDKMLLEYCNKIKDKYNISIGQVHKLIPNFNDKTKYVLNYRNLQLYIDLRSTVKRVHRVLEFDQYIDFNTQKITNAKQTHLKMTSSSL